MNDLHLHRLIRVAAAGSVLLTAMGCGSKKDEKDAKDTTPDHRAEDLFLQQCEVSLACDPDEFNAFYNSVDDCVTSSPEEYEAYAESEGQDCADSMLDLLPAPL